MPGLAALLALLAVTSLASIEILDYDPVANPEAVVISGNARFTVLTSQLIRMEYSENATFEDRATVAFLNRNVPLVPFTSSTTKGVLTIETANLILTYTTGTVFSQETLQINPVTPGAFQSWSYGQLDTGNLFGTIRSLDDVVVVPLNCTINSVISVHDESLHCEWGVVSRNGWAIVDDVTNYALDANYWWDGQNSDNIDIYMFAHGLNYRQALADFVLVAGKIAMVPRYATGLWWTRWFNFNTYDALKIVNDYQSRGLPLDVFVFDMDWHTKNSWTGYTWDPRLFPYPQDTLAAIKNNGLHVAANLHDADGVGSFESMYVPMATAVGINPNTNTTVPFNLLNQSWAYSLEDIVLQPVEEQGMDFWWIDWQSGGTAGGCTGEKQNPTIWTNHIRSTTHERRGENERGLVLGRWGGLGNHRYQVGFSGDVWWLAWDSLAYQPYFTMTASNVGFGFWSHDIEGPSNIPELYVRWVQWAAYSGVFRSHDRGMSSGPCSGVNPSVCSIVKMWDVSTPYFEANRFAVQTRISLVPYIYNAWRQAFDTGLSIVRPLYYDYPTYDAAYWASPNGSFPQYMFGDDLLVSPVVSPPDTTTTMNSQSIWLPPGLWFEQTSGSILTGEIVLTKDYDMTETPVFVKAGAVIPTIPVVIGNTLGLAQQQYNTLIFSVYPSGSPVSSGSTSVYEDDGITMDYLQGSSVTTNFTYEQNEGFFACSIISTGNFSLFPTTRTYIVRLISALPPQSVSVGGTVLAYSRFGGANTWTYDGVAMAVVIEVAGVSTVSTFSLEVQLSGDSSLVNGARGRIAHTLLAKSYLDQLGLTPGTKVIAGGALDRMSAVTDSFSYLAGTDSDAFVALLQQLPNMFLDAVDEVDGLKVLEPIHKAYPKALLASAL